MTHFELPEGISLVSDPLPGLRIETPAARGFVYLHGATVTEWTPAGERPVLWCSSKAKLDGDSPIRGGIPIVFPWFGKGRDGDLEPQHGFARLATWTLVQATVSGKGTATIILRLDGHHVDAPGAEKFTGDFGLEYHIKMGSTLQTQLVVDAGDEPLTFEEAFHTYFAVKDVATTRVIGLDGAAYLDRLTNTRGTQVGDITFDGEFDRILLSSRHLHIVDDDRQILIEKVGSEHTVVWNPGAEKAARLDDFADDEWPGMVCVESANCRDEAVTVAPDKRRMMAQTISIRH